MVMRNYHVSANNLLPLPRCTCNAPLNVNCRLHVNLDMEIIVVREGALSMCIGGTETLLQAGDGVFVLPFETHDFRTLTHSMVLIYTFPRDLIPVAGEFLSANTPQTRVFSVPRPLSDWLVAVCPPPALSNHVPDLEEAGMVAPLLSLLCRTCQFSAAPSRGNDLFLEALTQIDRHYTEEISLKTVARSLGITEKKLSRMLMREAKIPFSEYVTLRRLSCAKRLLSSGKRTVAQAAYEAGFSSIRTFNRVFLAHEHITPTAFLHRSNP